MSDVDDITTDIDNDDDLPVAIQDDQVPSDESLDELLKPPQASQTLSDLEKAVDSAHDQPTIAELPAIELPPVDQIRSDVGLAANLGPARPEPDADLNALDLGLDLGHTPTTPAANPDPSASTATTSTPAGPPPPVPPPLLPPAA